MTYYLYIFLRWQDAKDLYEAMAARNPMFRRRVAGYKLWDKEKDETHVFFEYSRQKIQSYHAKGIYLDDGLIKLPKVVAECKMRVVLENGKVKTMKRIRRTRYNKENRKGK